MPSDNNIHDWSFVQYSLGWLSKHPQSVASDLFIALSRERFARFGLKVVTPENPRIRDSHVSLECEHGYEIMQALIDRGVIGDFRAPDHMRFGFTPLYLGFEDIYRAIETLEDILEADAWRAPKYAERGAVT